MKDQLGILQRVDSFWTKDPVSIGNHSNRHSPGARPPCIRCISAKTLVVVFAFLTVIS
jgi:hypothetical protein